MDVEGILSELKKQRRRIDRTIAVVEMLKSPPQRKQRSNGGKQKSAIELSPRFDSLSPMREKSAIGKAGRRGRVISFGLRRRP